MDRYQSSTDYSVYYLCFLSTYVYYMVICNVMMVLFYCECIIFYNNGSFF